jgi:Cu-processing system permease protein
MNTTLKITSYVARDLMRSRWLMAYAGFIATATTLLLRFSDTEMKALLSLVNVVLLLVPLVTVVYGAMYLYSAREFVELLLAQPIRRSRLFAGLYFGLAVPMTVAVTGGLLLPMIILGVSRDAIGTALLLASMAATLSLAFTAIATAVAYAVEDQVRGLAVALGLWLLLAVVYDAGVLMAAVQFADYPLERPLLAAMFANPIDLGRLLLLTQFDAAALLGYTGALFEQLMGDVTGFLLAAGALMAWIALPAALGRRLFSRKDF